MGDTENVKASKIRKKEKGRKEKKSKRNADDIELAGNNNNEGENEGTTAEIPPDTDVAKHDRKKRKKKARSKERHKKEVQIENVDGKENTAFEEDSLVQEDLKQETLINLDDGPERPTLEKKSSSLKEIVVQSPQANSPDVAIDIPDLRLQSKEELSFQQDKEDSNNQEKQQGQNLEGINDNDEVLVVSTQENEQIDISSLGQRTTTPDRPTSAQCVGSPERPISAQRTATIERPSSVQGTGTQERPISAQRTATFERPSSAHRTGTQERPISAQRTAKFERPSSAQGTGTPERPISAQRTATFERPSSAQRAGTPEKLDSAQRIEMPVRRISAQSSETYETPSSAQLIETPDKPSSAQQIGNEEMPSSALRSESFERPSSVQHVALLKRPSSAQTSRTFERTSSAQQMIISKRPSSADSIQNPNRRIPTELFRTPDRSSSAKRSATFERPMTEVSSDTIIEEVTAEMPDSQKSDAELFGQKENELEVHSNVDKNGKLEEETSRRNLDPNITEGANMEEQKMSPPVEDTKDSAVIPIPEDGELPWAMYTKMKNRDEEESDKQKSAEDELAEQSESDDDAKYVPPTNEDLPDLYEVMGSLDTDEIELNLKTSPPSILDSEQQQIYQKQVKELKQGLAEDEIKVYLDEFEKQVEQEILMIGNISLDDVQDEERRLREEHISFQQQQAKVQRQRQQEILQAMERAKKYVMSKYKEKYRELRMREEHLMQRDRTYKDEIHRSFRRSESQLRKALKRRKAEVKTMYGDLIFADGQYGGSKGRRWKIDWNRAPQPIQIRLKCLRGVKDKLPASRYVLMVSLYNRLGGNVMKWSNLKGQQWGGATLPMYHDGEFFNIELKIDQSVFTVCPSRPDIRPGMLLIFELFILRGSVTPTDKVVGWGCFPICDAEFNVVEGKYKTPMLRGDMDPGIDKFEVIEKLMADDLENWLCNFYFEIIKLPRYMAGQKEYEVELQFTSGLLSSPDRTKTGEENIDGEKAVFGSRSDINSPLLSRASYRSESIVSSNIGNVDENGNVNLEKPPIPNILTVDTQDGSNNSAGGSRRKSSLAVPDADVQMFRAETLSANLRKGRSSVGQDKDLLDPLLRPMTSVAASRKLVEEKGLQFSDDDGDSSGTDYDEHDILALKKNVGFKPVKGQPGMFYKIHNNTQSDVYAKKIYTMMPKTALLSKQKRKKKLTHLEELDTHSFPVRSPWSNKGRIQHKGTKKMQYMGRMLLSELGISQVKSREFWAMILILLITYWIRLYCHYIGQWMALLGFLIPLNKFEFLPYTVNLNYQNTLLRTREEIALIVIGPFTNIVLFLMMVVLSAFIQFLFGRFSNIFSRFIIAFGIHSLLDPIWILITDSALQRFRNRGGDFPIGDAFKLYWHFNRYYNNDNVTLFVSIALTVFLYTVTMFSACTIMYMYFLRIHNNGRLMDVYWRLHGKHGDFFIPYDLEISNEELNFVCAKAERWRGEEGERRKTAVYDYIWEEEEMADEDWDNPSAGNGKKTGASETTTHVSIHTLHLDGLRELYRHFLKLPDGGIVEVFGEMNIPGIDEGVKQALIKRTTYQSMSGDGPRKRRPSRASSTSTIQKDEGGRKLSNSFLDVPPTSSFV